MKVLEQQDGRGWVAYHGDSCEVLRGLPADSVHFSVYSPPFASLYTYSASERDLGNCRTDAEFFGHFTWLMPEMLRVTKPGRNMSVHCMDLPTSKSRDGVIGLRDFPGALIRAAQDAGWIWHGKVTIWKDPVTQMQRTKTLGLLHRQIKKDSCMSRPGLADYVLTFRKPGENAEPVSHTADEFPVSQWQQWASPIWTVDDSTKDLELLAQTASIVWGACEINASDTIQHRSAREERDERHICPLQLEVIRRCVKLWSNPGEIVLSPFGGIGSEGYVAVEEGRRAVLVELKGSYFQQLVANLRSIEPGAQKQQTLFDAFAPVAPLAGT